MPAINIINGLKSPQGLRDRDLSLAFVGSFYCLVEKFPLLKRGIHD